MKGKPGIWLELSDFNLIDSGIEPDYDTSQSIIREGKWCYPPTHCCA